jgi:hypothetical protein
MKNLSNQKFLNFFQEAEEKAKNEYNPDKKPPDLRRAEIHGVRFDGYAEG